MAANIHKIFLYLNSFFLINCLCFISCLVYHGGTLQQQQVDFDF